MTSAIRLQKLDASTGRTQYIERWDKYCRASSDYRGRVPNKDPAKKDLPFLRDLVCSLYLSDYFVEFAAYWDATQGGGDGPRADETRSGTWGTSTSSGSTSWTRRY